MKVIGARFSVKVLVVKDSRIDSLLRLSFNCFPEFLEVGRYAGQRLYNLDGKGRVFWQNSTRLVIVEPAHDLPSNSLDPMPLEAFDDDSCREVQPTRSLLKLLQDFEAKANSTPGLELGSVVGIKGISSYGS